jgi:hypothetical protein
MLMAISKHTCGVDSFRVVTGLIVPAQGRRPRAQSAHLSDGQSEVQGRLRQNGAPPGKVVRPDGAQHSIIDLNGAGIGRPLARQDFDPGRFACAAASITTNS